MLNDFLQGQYNDDIQKIQETVVEQMNQERVHFGDHYSQSNQYAHTSIYQRDLYAEANLKNSIKRQVELQIENVKDNLKLIATETDIAEEKPFIYL